jgi:TonB-linked SusC/RagA family outer membrane protein
LEGKEMAYTVYDRQIVLSNTEVISEMVAQQNSISGTVTDENGEPIPGVTVLVMGTTMGNVTNMDGKYSISNISDGTTLQFSFVGMTSQEIEVGTQTSINITLVASSIGIDEVVAIGYGTVNRREVTGAIGSVKADDFVDGLALAPEQLLNGKVAGVSIVQESGEPGAASSVRIRGSSSVSAGNEPLYVIDGVPLQFSNPSAGTSGAGEHRGETGYGHSTSSTNPLNIINASDIESIDVLKDASATAIYGSRGANGVIIITTKNKGRSGDVVTYNGYVGFSSVTENLPFLTADEFRKLGDDNNLEYPDEGANTDWQDEIYKTAVSQNHNLSFAGGSATANYRASFGYSKEDGIINDGGLTKYNARINAIHKAFDGKLNMSTTMAYSQVENDRKAASRALVYAYRWAPTLPVKNQDGSYYQLGEQRVNPVSYNEIDDLTKTNMFLGNMSLSYNILESLKFNVDLGYSNEARNQFSSIPDSHPAAETQGGLAAISKFTNGTSLIETNFTYDKQITANSHLTALAGYSFQRFETETTFTEANQFVSTAIQWNLMQSGNMLSNTSYKEANRLASYYARVNYKLMDRYIFTATVRRD